MLSTLGIAKGLERREQGGDEVWEVGVGQTSDLGSVMGVGPSLSKMASS